MAVISDILLVAGALGAAVYCMVLSRRLRRFNDLEKGMGGAIAVLSAQVDDMTRALTGAQSSARASSGTLVDLTSRAEGVAQRLELLVASLHDLPLSEVATQTPPPDTSATARAMPIETSPPEDAPAEAVAPLPFLRTRRADTAAARAAPLVLRHRAEGPQ